MVATYRGSMAESGALYLERKGFKRPPHHRQKRQSPGYGRSLTTISGSAAGK